MEAIGLSSFQGNPDKNLRQSDVNVRKDFRVSDIDDCRQYGSRSSKDCNSQEKDEESHGRLHDNGLCSTSLRREKEAIVEHLRRLGFVVSDPYGITIGHSDNSGPRGRMPVDPASSFERKYVQSIGADTASSARIRFLQTREILLSRLSSPRLSDGAGIHERTDISTGTNSRRTHAAVCASTC